MSQNKIEQKSIVKNAMFNVIYRVFNMIFPLITAAYTAHVLKASGVGKVSIAQNVVQYFVLFAPLGISNYGIREVAKKRGCGTETNKLFTELFLINFWSTFLCVSIYYCLIMCGNNYETERSLFLVAGLLIVFNFINVEWFYQGVEDYVYISVRSIIVKSISLIAMLIFVKSESDYIIYAFIYVLGIGGNSVFNIINLHKNGVCIKFCDLNIKRHFKPILIFLCSNIAIEIYTLLDTTMLGYMCTDEIVGYYTNSIKLVRIIVALIAAVGGVLLPRLSYYKKEEMIDECSSLISNVVKIIWIFAIPCGIGVAILAPQLIGLLFGESFMPAVNTVRIATILIYVLGFSNLFGTQVLLTFEQEKKLLLSTIMGALVNMGLNLVLIPQFQHNGAVIASVISETLVTMLTYLYAAKYIKLHVSLKFVVQVVLAGLIMCVPVLGVVIIVNNSFWAILAAVLFGSSTYFAIILFFKDDIVKVVFDILERRMREKNEKI